MRHKTKFFVSILAVFTVLASLGDQALAQPGGGPAQLAEEPPPVTELIVLLTADEQALKAGEAIEGLSRSRGNRFSDVPCVVGPCLNEPRASAYVFTTEVVDYLVVGNAGILETSVN